MHNIPFTRIRIALAAVFLLGTVAPLLGQISASQDVFLPPDHLLRRQLEDAKEALKEAQYNDAVRLLGELLVGDARDNTAAGAEVEDYFLEPPAEGAAQRSLKAEARRILATLPREGLDAYQLLYGREAELMLQEAVKRGDVDALTEITRKYFHTQAGYQSAMLLGRHYLSRGQPLAAALSLKQLHEVPAARKFEPELSLLLSSSWMLAGQDKRAEEVLAALGQNQPGVELLIAGSQTRLPATPDERLIWLRGRLGDLQLGGKGLEEQWVLFRGNAARNAPTKGGTPLAQVRWLVETPNDPLEQKTIKEQQQAFIKGGDAALPVLHPLVVRHADDNKQNKPRHTVITRTAQRLFGVDFQTGRRVWYFPYDEDQPRNENASIAAAATGASSPEAIKLKQRTWSDAPYGQVSSDGSNVYVLHELGFADKIGPDRFVGQGGIIFANPDRPKSFNQLVALDLSLEGSLLWSVGDVDGGDESELAGAFFLGPPLPLMGKLYALAEVKGDIRLVVLDPNTGRLQWQQQLCGVDNQAILNDASRRLGGAAPSFSEGVMICPTSAGAIVAVDIAKRSLLWGYQYVEPPKQPPSGGPFFQVRSNRSNKPQPGHCWADATVTIVGDKVLVTPVEVDEEHAEIICLDLLEGTVDDKPLWRRDRKFDVDDDDLKREDFEGLYVGCVHDGIVVLVGKSHVAGLKLEDGATAWYVKLSDGPPAMPSGRGYLSKGSYYLPLTTSELVQIELGQDKAEIVQRTPTKGVLGNLVCYQDTVISQGVGELSSFYQREALGDIVARRLEASPDDPWALHHKGLLLLKDGQRDEAIEYLRKSNQVEPSDAVRSLLFDTLLAALEDKFNQDLADEAEALIDRPDQRAEYWRQMAESQYQTGQHRSAFDCYLKLVDEYQAAPGAIDSSPTAGKLQQVAGALRVRPQRWIRSRLAQLRHDASPEVQKALDEAIAARLKTALDENSITSLRHFIEFFGQHPSADQARLSLAGRLWISGELLEAELILTELVDSPRQQIAARATAQMARLQADAGHVEEAVQMYARLRDRFAEVDCGDGKTGRQILNELAAESMVAKTLRQPSDWPLGHVEVTEHDNEDDAQAPKLQYSTYQHVYPTTIRQVQGPGPAGGRIVMDRNRRVYIRDGLGRQDVWLQLNGAQTSRAYISNYSITHAKMSGHLVMLGLGYELFALDMMRGSSNARQRVLWRESLADSSSESNQRLQAEPKLRVNPWGGHRYEAADEEGKSIVSFTTARADGVCFLRWGQLLCVDPLRPEIVHWSRDGVDRGARIFGDGEVVLLIDHEAKVATVLSALDGRELGVCKIGDQAEFWQTLGRQVLRWRKNEDQTVTVAMLDPWDEEIAQVREDPVIWEHQFTTGARGDMIEQNEAAVLQTDGKLTLIDLETGQARFEAQLAEQPKLEGLHVLRGRDEYTVVASARLEESPDGLKVRAAPGGFGSQGQYSPSINAEIYCLSRATGESLWPSPATVEYFGLPLDQPTQLPVLVFMRNVTRDDGAPASKWQTEIVCLDKRDGRVVFHKNDIPGETRVYRLVGNPEEKSAALMLPGLSYTLRWTDNPRPPEPPAQVAVAE